MLFEIAKLFFIISIGSASRNVSLIVSRADLMVFSLTCTPLRYNDIEVRFFKEGLLFASEQRQSIVQEPVRRLPRKFNEVEIGNHISFSSNYSCSITSMDNQTFYSDLTEVVISPEPWLKHKHGNKIPMGSNIHVQCLFNNTKHKVLRFGWKLCQYFTCKGTVIDFGFIGSLLTYTVNFEAMFAICYIKVTNGNVLFSYPVLFRSEKPVIKYKRIGMNQYHLNDNSPIYSSSTEKVKLKCNYPIKTDTSYEWYSNKNDGNSLGIFQRLNHKEQEIEIICSSFTCSYQCNIEFMHLNQTSSSNPIDIVVTTANINLVNHKVCKKHSKHHMSCVLNHGTVTASCRVTNLPPGTLVKSLSLEQDGTIIRVSKGMSLSKWFIDLSHFNMGEYMCKAQLSNKPMITSNIFTMDEVSDCKESMICKFYKEKDCNGVNSFHVQFHCPKKCGTCPAIKSKSSINNMNVSQPYLNSNKNASNDSFASKSKICLIVGALLLSYPTS